MGESPLIAVVDDDASAREAAAGLVRALGFAAAAFPGAAAFLASPERARAACLIADQRMPGMTGIELHRALGRAGTPLPTILVTAWPEPTVRARAAAAGIGWTLSKPLDPDGLLACLRAALAAPTEGARPMPDPKLEVLTPANSQLIFIDHQPQMAFGVQSIDRQTLKNNVVGLAKAAKVFGIPTTITTVETESFSGFTYPELLDVFPDHKLLERTSMNSWDDRKVRDALAANGRRKVVVSGLWTEVCNTTFALCAMLEGGYEIYMVADASGGTSKEAHDYAMQRMVQAGAVPVTWQQVLLEWQRDWARRETYDAVIAVVREHSGAYGMGVDYAYTMVHDAPQRTAAPHEALAPVPAA